MPRRHSPKSGAYPNAIKETPFQTRVVGCAIQNGWRIAYEDTLDSRASTAIGRALRRFFGTIEKARDFIWGRKRQDFPLVYHTHDSRRSSPGFPDLVLVHPTHRRIIFAELKKVGRYPTTEQRLWLAGLTAASEGSRTVSVFLWDPRDWEEIVRELGGIDSRLFL